MASCPLTISCLLLFLPLVLILLAHAGRRRSRSCRLPPGPRPLPIVGNLHQVGAAPQVSLTELAAEHGPLMFLRLGSVPTLIISSSDAVREAIKNHDLALSSRPKIFAGEKLLYGLRDVGFSPYGEYWRQARKVFVGELLSAKRVQSFRVVREEEVARLVATIREESSSSSSPTTTIDLSRKMLAMTNNVVCRAAFGDKYGDGSGIDVHRILAEAQHVLGGFCTADFFPWLRWIHAIDGLQARVEKVFKELDHLYIQMIEAHQKRGPSSEEDADMVHVLLRLHEDPTHRETFNSMDHIKALITDVFIAGTDTAASSVVWTMTNLMKHPQVMSQVQKEVRDVVGNKGEVEDSDRENLQYLKLVINETFRLHPPAPLLLPRETTDAMVIGGYEIPAKTRVYINAVAVGRDPAAWGSNAREFSPERFLNCEIDYRGSCFEFIPFGTGRRICPGISFGMAVVELALANLLYSFDWELPPGMSSNELDFEAAFGAVMHKKTPLRLVARPYNV